MPLVKKDNRLPIIDLTGPQGNVFYLIAQAQVWAKTINFSADKTEELVADMMSKDYYHAVELFYIHFNKICTIEINDSALLNRLEKLS